MGTFPQRNRFCLPCIRLYHVQLSNRYDLSNTANSNLFSIFVANPVNKENMNYTSAAIGVIGLVSLVTWITTGRHKFTGPKVAIQRQDSDSLDTAPSPTSEKIVIQ